MQSHQTKLYKTGGSPSVSMCCTLINGMYTQVAYLKMLKTPLSGKNTNTERCHKIYPILLPFCIMAMAG